MLKRIDIPMGELTTKTSSFCCLLSLSIMILLFKTQAWSQNPAAISVQEQAEWSVPITISLINGDQDSIAFGTRIDATDGLDPGIDILNPPPPPDGFDAFFQITNPIFPNLSVDYRSNFVTPNSWTLVITATNGGVGTLNWDASEFPAGGATPGTLQIRSGETVLADMLAVTSLNFVGDQSLTIFFEAPIYEVVAQANCAQAFVENCPNTVPIDIDVTGAEPGDLLGSYSATLTWDPALLDFVGWTGGAPPFDTPNVNEANVAIGELTFGQSVPAGAGGVINVINVEFNVIGTAPASGNVDLALSELTAAGTSADLLPIARIEDCTFAIEAGCLLGDVTLDNDATVFDALIIATHAVQLPIPPEFLAKIDQGCGDVTLDGDTSVFDALVIATFAVGLPVDPFPVEQPLCP